MQSIFVVSIGFLIVLNLRMAQSTPIYNGNLGDVQVSGSFKVVGENEQVSSNYSPEDVQEHPFFELEAMKIARAYLDKQYAKEKAARMH